MDQVYIPKKRSDFPIGSYVIIKPLETEKREIKPFFYNISYLEPIKIEIIKRIIQTIDKNIKSDNIIITGSFLDKGFRFNDIDILLITENKANIKELLESRIGIKIHLIAITNKALLKGLSTDPLYKLMLIRCVSKKRLIYKSKQIINYKLLDLHLLKSNLLINNFDLLEGNEKYGLVRNLVAISLFIDKKPIKDIDSIINSLFGSNTVENLKNNILSKKDFLHKYKKIYNGTKSNIIKHIKNGSKQKQTD